MIWRIANLLVAQDRVHVEVFSRQADGGWFLRDWNDPSAEIEIPSPGCRPRVAEIYAKVKFEDVAG
jgi:Uma2 family endonuclease